MSMFRREIEIDDFMKNTLFLFKTVAITPYHGFTFRKPSRIQSMLFTLLVLNTILQFIGEVIYVVKYFSRLAVIHVTESVSHIEFGILCFTKVIVIVYYHNTTALVMFKLKKIFPLTSSKQRECQVQNYIQFATKTSKYWIRYFFAAHVGFVLMPISQSCVEYYVKGKFGYLTPIHAWYPFSYKQPVIYSIVYFHQFWGVYWIGAIILCTDLLLGSMLIQICMHLDLIAKYFMRVKENEGNLETIRYLGRYHCIVTRLSKHLSQIFNIIILVNVFISSCTICFIAQQITSAEARVHAANYVMTLLFLSAQVYQISYFGSKLIESSDNLAAAVYNHNWYSQPPEYRKAVLFILMRCQRTSSLSVGGYNVLSVATFGQVFKFSYKIFTLLNAV